MARTVYPGVHEAMGFRDSGWIAYSNAESDLFSDDGQGRGYPGLRLYLDALGTEDGLSQYPYIRESRRILAQKTIVEQEVSEKFRPGEKLAERYEDSVGIGYYRIDLHPSTGGDNYIETVWGRGYVLRDAGDVEMPEAAVA